MLLLAFLLTELIMKIIYKKRRAGKTTELINIAANGFYYIICTTTEEAGRVARQAEELGKDIPMPISFDEFVNKRFNPAGIKGFLIDNADLLLQHIAGQTKIEAISISEI